MPEILLTNLRHFLDSHISEHHHIMAETSAHHKEMEDLMGTEILMFGIEDRKFQGVNDAADGINDTAGQKPSECARCQGCDDLFDRGETYPAHGDVDQGGEPFRTVDPECVHQNADGRDGPNQSQEAVADRIAEDDQADRSVGSCDQDEDHHVIDLAKYFIDMFGNVEGVVDGTGGIKQDHADNEDGKCRGAEPAGCDGGFDDQRDRGCHGQDHRDKVSQGTAWVFDVRFHNLPSISSLNVYVNNLLLVCRDIVLKTMSCDI